MAIELYLPVIVAPEISYLTLKDYLLLIHQIDCEYE